MEKALAYILITTRHGYSKKVARELMDFKDIQNVHELFGQYDLLVKLLSDNNKQLSEFVDNNLLSIPEIERTETLVVSDIAKECCY